MKNLEKLQSIQNKISDLRKIETELQNKSIDDISKKIANLIIKKRAYSIDLNSFLDRVSSIIDEMKQ